MFLTFSANKVEIFSCYKKHTDRNNIHKIDEEELVLTINDQLFFEMILLKIRGLYYYVGKKGYSFVRGCI